MIKFLDLEKINNRFREEIDARIKSILDKGLYILGDEVRNFEDNFARLDSSERLWSHIASCCDAEN